MKDFYVDAGEEITPNAPKPRGKPVQINCFVDSDHAGDRENQISQTELILYCNSAQIIWYSKRQNTVESPTLGAECLALQIATELIVSSRYKLILIGVTIEGAENYFCDNEFVYKNASFAKSQLRKKHQSTCFYPERECMASGIIIVHEVDTNKKIRIC